MLATFSVNVDYDAAGPFNLTDTDVTLREAVFRANQIDDTDTINFDASLDGETITLGIDELGNNLNLGFNGDIDITESVTIDASMLTNGITIDASGNDDTPLSTLDDGNDNNDGDGSRIFNISADFLDVITIDGLTFTGGDAGGDGGAIRSRNDDTNLLISNSIFFDNFALGFGGAIYKNVGLLEIDNTLLRDNATINNGGGLYLGGSLFNATVTGTTFLNNVAGNAGGGLGMQLNSSEYASIVTVDSSRFEGNESRGSSSSSSSVVGGGGIYADLYGDNFSNNALRPVFNLTNTTVVDNSAAGDGGGVWVCTKLGKLRGHPTGREAKRAGWIAVTCCGAIT